MLFTKSILKPKATEDGIRISVMSRHTLEDGKTLDPRITKDSYDEHLHSLAPPANLVGDYYKRGLKWSEYEVRYLEHIRKGPIAQEVRKLASRALLENITLLCIEDTPERCHRRLLAEECQRYVQRLKVIHN